MTIAPRYAALGIDLKTGASADLALTLRGDLALTTNGRETLAADLRHLLDTLPGDLFGHPTYGAGLARLLGEEDHVSFVPTVQRAISDALIYETAVASRIEPESVEVKVLARPDGRSAAFRVSFSTLDETTTSEFNYVIGDNATTEDL